MKSSIGIITHQGHIFFSFRSIFNDKCTLVDKDKFQCRLIVLWISSYVDCSSVDSLKVDCSSVDHRHKI